jgi:hypothetical protein
MKDMNKLFIAISIIAVCFCSVPVFAGGPETIDTKKVTEDLKGDRMRAEEALSQNEQELKEFLEQAKWEKSVAEGKTTNTAKEKSVRPGEVKTPSVRPEGVVRPEEVKILPVSLERVKIPPASAEEDNFLDSATSVPVQRGLYFLIAICFGLMYYYRIVTYKKKLAAEKKRGLLDDSLLAEVEQWRLSEGDFKNYQDKLIPLVDAQLLDINSPEFKKHFIKDMAITEIIFQFALNENLQADPALATSLSQYKLYLSDLDKEASIFSNTLDNYRRSLTLTAGQQVPYAAYYKDFLNLLMILNKQDDRAVFELYQRYLLINKLVGKAGRSSADTGEIQQELDSVINKFKSEHNVIIKEEGIEPPKEEQITG